MIKKYIYRYNFILHFVINMLCSTFFYSLLQAEFGYLVIIEKIQGKQTISKKENINIETDS